MCAILPCLDVGYLLPTTHVPTLCVEDTQALEKDQFIGELEFSFLAKVICRLSIIWQKRAQLTDAREHTGRNWNLWKRKILVLKASLPVAKEIQKFLWQNILKASLPVESREIHIQSTRVASSSSAMKNLEISPELQAGHHAGLWQGWGGWWPQTGEFYSTMQRRHKHARKMVMRDPSTISLQAKLEKWWEWKGARTWFLRA